MEDLFPKKTKTSEMEESFLLEIFAKLGKNFQ